MIVSRPWIKVSARWNATHLNVKRQRATSLIMKVLCYKISLKRHYNVIVSYTVCFLHLLLSVWDHTVWLIERTLACCEWGGNCSFRCWRISDTAQYRPCNKGKQYTCWTPSWSLLITVPFSVTLGQPTNGFGSSGEESRLARSIKMCYLLSVQLGQVAQSHSERLGVVLLDPIVDRLQTAHVEKQLGLLHRHGAAQDTGTHWKGLGWNADHADLLVTYFHT